MGRTDMGVETCGPLYIRRLHPVAATVMFTRPCMMPQFCQQLEHFLRVAVLILLVFLPGCATLRV